MMDAYLEESYRSFKQRQGQKGDTAKKRRRRLGAGGELSDEEGEGEGLGELPGGESSEDEEEVGCTLLAGTLRRRGRFGVL